MALNLDTKRPEPPRIIVYGNHGLGKSTFASMAPNPVFIQTEDGLSGLDTPRFSKAESFDDVISQLGELYTEDHDFKTVIIDSLDHLEPLVWAKLIKENPTGDKGNTIENIEDFGYGKGYVRALDVWRQYITAIEMLRKDRGVIIIQTAHSQVKKYENPMSDPYDRFEMKLQDKAKALLQENADIVFFANYASSLVKKKDKSGNERIRAIGSGDRILYTEERPAFQAKNRFSLPAEIPLDRDGGCWGVIVENVPFFKTLVNQTEE